MSTYTMVAQIGDWTFYQVEDHGFPQYEGQPMFACGKTGETNDMGIPKVGEYFASLDRALIAAVGEHRLALVLGEPA